MKLSIITVNRNNAEGLLRTIGSVVSQTFTDFEYIVIDGVSTDNSVAVIKRYADKLSYWISEADSGIYNAMNKGIEVAKGEYLLFLNSGDVFLDENSLHCFDFANENSDIIYGDLLIRAKDEDSVNTYPDKLQFSYFINDSLPHPASAIKKSLLLEMGKYDENKMICADWEFFVKAVCLKSCSYKHIDKIIAVFYLDGISSFDENAHIIDNEKKSVIEQFFIAFKADYDELQYLRRVRERILEHKVIKILKQIGCFKNKRYFNKNK